MAKKKQDDGIPRELLSMAYIAISRVKEPIQNRAYQRPLAHKAKLDLVMSRLTGVHTQ